MKRRTCQDRVAALPGVSHTGHSFHLRHQTGSWAQFFFFQSLSLFNWLTGLFFTKWKKKVSTCSKFMLCHLAPFFQPGRTCSNSLEKPLRAVDSNVKINEPHGCIISARKNSLGQSQSTHVLCCFFFSFEREKKKREEGEREREEGGRKKAGQSMCGVGEKWIKKITKWRVLTLGTQWWYLEQKWPKNGSFYPPFSDENTRLRKLSNSPISNSHTSKIRSQISQFRTWTTFNSTHSAFRCREVCVTYPAYYKGLDI